MGNPGDSVRPSGRARILVVDDRKSDQLLVGYVLGDLADVTFASGGDEAIAACRQTAFSAVVMDVQMSGTNGYEAVRTIREHERRVGRPRVPIVGLSARDVAGDREAALTAGMDEYLVKPLRIGRLVEALARCLPDVPVIDDGVGVVATND